MKKILQVSLSTILGILSILLIEVPTTNSRYLKKEETALSYHTTFYKTYAGEFDNKIELIKEKSTADEAYFEFLFAHSNATVNAVKDAYEINFVAPAVCEIDETNVTPLSKFDKETNTFEYVPETDYDDTKESYMIVGMKCKVDSITRTNEVTSKDELYLKVSIKEKMTFKNNTASRYDYLDLIYHLDLDQYEYIKPTDTITIPETEDVYDKFMKWITTYAKSTKYESEILNYVNAVVTKENVTNIPFPLLGIDSSFNNDDKTYTFSIGENFIGYVRTYAESKHSHGTLMFFTSKEKDTLEFAIDYYLKTYAYKNDLETYEKVLAYLNSRGGITALILENKKIPGFTYIQELDEVLMSNNILDYINLEEIEHSFELPFDFGANMESVFKEKLMLVASDILSDKAKQDLVGRTTIGDALYNSYVKNRSCPTNDPECKRGYKEKIDFIDYFVYYDEENAHYVFIKIYSDAATNPLHQYNKIEIDTYEGEKDSITLTNKTNNILEINITSTLSNVVNDGVGFLNTYLNEVSTPSVTLVDGKYVANYEITKVIPVIVDEEVTP